VRIRLSYFREFVQTDLHWPLWYTCNRPISGEGPSARRTEGGLLHILGPLRSVKARLDKPVCRCGSVVYSRFGYSRLSKSGVLWNTFVSFSLSGSVEGIFRVALFIKIRCVSVPYETKYWYLIANSIMINRILTN